VSTVSSNAAFLIGLPGSLADVLRAFLSSITTAMSPLAVQWSFFNTMPATISAGQLTHTNRIKALLRDADEAISTLANIDRLLDSVFEKSRDMTQKFLSYTSEMQGMVTTNTTARRAYWQQFHQVVKMRESSARTTLPARMAAQTSIMAFRNAIARAAAEFQMRNREFRMLFDAVHLGYMRVAEYCANSSEAIRRQSGTIDFVSDFTAFVRDTHLVRYDLSDMEFEVVRPAVPDISPRIEIEIAPVYPIGLAQVVHDHDPDGKNQLRCKAGKSVFLMELPDEGWVLAMNPFTLVSGFVPQICLQKVGHGLAVILKGQDTVEAGECVAIVDDSTPTTSSVETVFGHRIAVSKTNLGVIFTEQQ
jgi:hypothetical protein